MKKLIARLAVWLSVKTGIDAARKAQADLIEQEREAEWARREAEREEQRRAVVLVSRPDAQYIASAHEFAKHVEKQAEPWEWKQRQVLRALRNRYPEARVRDLNLAIEIVVQECSALEW